MQKLYHWLEHGTGSLIIKNLAIIGFIILLSLYICYKRQKGPENEFIFEETIVAKNLAEGNGYATQVIYPKSVAILESNKKSKGEKFNFEPNKSIPELYRPPGYATLLAFCLKILPENIIEKIWQDPVSETPRGVIAYNADYFLLTVNVIIFWVVCLLTYILGKALFGTKGGSISLFGTIFSAALWDQVLKVNGSVILMMLFLLILILYHRLELNLNSENNNYFSRKKLTSGLCIGILVGLSFLTEYSAGLIGLAVLWMTIFYHRKKSFILIVFMIIGFSATISPWIIRNLELTNSPISLAWTELPLYKIDTNYSMEMFKSDLSSDYPKISIRKIIGKGLSGIEKSLTAGIWSGGAFIFCGLFISGCFYKFKNLITNNVRWTAVSGILILLLVQPFLNSGDSVRLPINYIAPILIIFGSGFLLVLTESKKSLTTLSKSSILFIIILIQALPLVNKAAKPKSIPFHFPPYIPSTMVLTRTIIMEGARINGFGIMSDIPAGLTWYSRQPVWAQPKNYAQFVEISLYQDIGALFLSPARLNQPYFSTLTSSNLSQNKSISTTGNWSEVYKSLQNREMPNFFPLKNVYQIWENVYILTNPIIDLNNNRNKQ